MSTLYSSFQRIGRTSPEICPLENDNSKPSDEQHRNTEQSIGDPLIDTLRHHAEFRHTSDARDQVEWQEHNVDEREIFQQGIHVVID